MKNAQNFTLFLMIPNILRFGDFDFSLIGEGSRDNHMTPGRFQKMPQGLK